VPGDKVAFAKYCGVRYLGKDKQKYLLLNDEDIIAKIDEDLELTDIPREAFWEEPRND
jgi:hypothetical protein